MNELLRFLLRHIYLDVNSINLEYASEALIYIYIACHDWNLHSDAIVLALLHNVCEISKLNCSLICNFY